MNISFSKVDFEYSLEYDSPITSFTTIPIFLDNVPQHVHAVNLLIQFPDYEGNLLKTTKHSVCYPILKNNEGKDFILIHFMWMFDVEQLTTLTEMSSEERAKLFEKLPKKTLITLQYAEPTKPYCDLIKVEKVHLERKITARWDLETNETDAEPVNISKNKKAIIFLHGLQTETYNRLHSNFNCETCNGWRSPELMTYWENFYKSGDLDYFEFSYDSYFGTMTYYSDSFIKLLEKSGVIENYDEIYLVGYSMGAIVAQYAINSLLHDEKIFLGEKIDKVFLIGGVLEGTYFINFADYILEHISVDTNMAALQTECNDEHDTFLFQMLSLLENYRELLFDPEKILLFLNNFVEFYQKNPIISCLLLINFDDIPVIGGRLVPYEAVQSMRYTSEEFLERLEKTFNFSNGTFKPNEDLATLNSQHHFAEKLVLMTSYTTNSEEFLAKTSILLKQMTFISKATDALDDEQLLTIPFVRYLIQRILSKLICSFAEIIKEEEHILNDGFVTHWSQSFMPNNSDIRKENIYIFDNLDHAEIKLSEDVINTILNHVK